MDVPTHLVANSELSSSARLVLMVLYGSCKWENAHKPFTYSSIESIRQQAGGMSRSTVDRAIRQLTKIKVIKRTRIEGQFGLALAPHPRAKGAIPHEFEDLATGLQTDERRKNASPVTQKCVTSDALLPLTRAAPDSECVTSDAPYNIGIKLKADPPVPPRGDSAVDKPDRTDDKPDEERAESPTAQVELLPVVKPKPRPKPRAKPRAKSRATAPTREDIEAVFAALCEARALIAERTGERLTTIKIISREDFIKKAIGRHGLSQVIESLRNQGELGSPKALSILTNAETPFRSANVKRALDRDELKRLAEYDCPADGRVVRRVMDVRGVQTL